MKVSEFIHLVEKNAKPKGVEDNIMGSKVNYQFMNYVFVIDYDPYCDPEDKLVAITNTHNNELIYVNKAVANIVPGLGRLHNENILDKIAHELEYRQWP
ncbi:MAG: hypothetical protein H3Z52_09800 [archaeon]|nr:hypothetical protein [archaeon]